MTSREEHHKHKLVSLLEEKVTHLRRVFSQAIQEYTVVFSRRHNEKSQEGKILRIQTRIKPLRKKIWKYPTKYLLVPFQQAIKLLGIYPKNTVAKIQKGTKQLQKIGD